MSQQEAHLLILDIRERERGSVKSYDRVRAQEQDKKVTELESLTLKSGCVTVHLCDLSEAYMTSEVLERTTSPAGGPACAQL